MCNLPYSGKPFISRRVLSLKDRLELCVSGAEGYRLFTDKYCSDVQLAQELDSRKCQTTGTIISGRCGSPEPVRKGAMKKMESGDTFAHRRGNVLLMGWEDKRVVLIMSAYHDTSVEKMVTIQKMGAAERNSKVIVCTQLYRAYRWCRSE
jgi:hypothetical protein